MAGVTVSADECLAPAPAVHIGTVEWRSMENTDSLNQIESDIRKRRFEAIIEADRANDELLLMKQAQRRALTDEAVIDLQKHRDDYLKFLASKAPIAQDRGYAGPLNLNPDLKPHARDIAEWMIRGGNRACFASYGLHKTSIQLQVCESLLDAYPGESALVVCPLGVRREFIKEAKARGFKRTPVYIATNEDHDRAIAAGHDLFLTNYERVRDGKLDPNRFLVCSLDEASTLRSYGSKTYQEFLPLFSKVRFKFVATATPSPNRLKELIHYAGFLGIMDTGQALTRFFQRDSTQAGNLTLHPHKVREFWLWVKTWAVFIQLPSDLGYSDEGYIRPEIKIILHRLPADHSTAGYDSWGQGKLIRSAAAGLSAAAKEKRDSLDDRVAEVKKIIDSDGPDVHHIVWHDLNPERDALKKAIPGLVTITGDQSINTLDERERIVERFASGEIKDFGTKSSLSGSGSNFQEFCWSNIFCGIGYKANDFMQAIHRTDRFGQIFAGWNRSGETPRVEVHLIFTEAEDPIYEELMRKIGEHNTLHSTMSALIREYGLSNHRIGAEMNRSISIDRFEVKSDLYTAVNNDCVLELMSMPAGSIDLAVTSIPFGNHYEYCESYNDMGHTDDDTHFFQQMDFMTPNLLRVMKPGRIACVHVKDRILYGSVTGLGMYSVNRFSDKTAEHFEKHGFIFCGRITVVTDVVRENGQTYRMGWTENSKDGTKMGVGSPEYILLFRKLPSELSNAYADTPVLHAKPLCENPLCECGHSKFVHARGICTDEECDCIDYNFSEDLGEPVEFRDDAVMIPGSGYSRAHWQFDAHSFWRSNGDRLMEPGEVASMPMAALRALWRKYSGSSVYNFKEHVSIAEEMEKRGILPSGFMALDVVNPGSPNVWDDVTRMRTLNSEQFRKGKEMHVCPLQLDIIERLTGRYSNPGDLVLDMFGGIGSVAQQAVLMDRRSYSIELNADYHADAVSYCRAAENKILMPTLFDMLAEDASEVNTP